MQYWLYMLMSVVCKISVPIFFMISGALLLPKKDETPQVLVKRIFRIGIVLLLFSFLSYLQQIYQGYETFDLKRFVIVLIENDWMSPYWYLYAFMAYLMALPFMRALVQKLENWHYLYLIVLQIVFSGIIPIALYYFGQGEHHINYNFLVGWLIANVPFYPLIGHFLENVFDINKMSKRHLTLLWSANIICILLTCYMTYYDNMLVGGFAQTFLMSLVSVNCITIYITAKKLFEATQFAECINQLIISLGRATFGIYLIHGLLLREPGISVWNRVLLRITINPMISCLIRCMEVFAIGYFITLLLKRVPGIKKLV